MTRLVSIRGGGEHVPPPPCPVCGLPNAGPCGILRRHLDWRRLRGDTPATRYSAEKGILLLGAHLPVPVTDATPEHLREWQASLRLSPGALANYTSRARCFYRWALGEGLITADPSARLPVPRTGRRLPRPIPAPDLFGALELASPRVRPWLVLAAFAGLRAQEVARLTRESVLEDAPRPVILVTAEMAKGRRERVVPLSAWVVAEIRTWRLPRAGYCFRRADGGPLAAHNVSQQANAFLHGAGLPNTFHSLRHFFGTEALEASGGNARVVQELLGHQNLNSTQVYTAVSPASGRTAVEGIPHPPRLQAVSGKAARRR